MADSEIDRRPRRFQPGAAAIAMILLAAVLACLVAALSLNWYAASTPSAGLPVTACAGFVLTPHLQIGAAWQSPLSSYLSPLATSPFAACVHLPHAWVAPTRTIHTWEWLWP